MSAPKRFWFLDHDEETGDWSEITEPDRVAVFQEDAEKNGESVLYYDGWVYCVTALAATLEEAVERAKALEREQYQML